MSLGLKLYILLLLVLVSCLSIFTVLDIKLQKEGMVNHVQISALRTSDVIKHSIHYSMLINRKDHIDETFKDFSHMPGFEVIRMYDKTGKIIFSTDPDEKGKQISIEHNTCQVCHSEPEPIKMLDAPKRHRLVVLPNGKEVLSLINPIENDKQCENIGCHASPKVKAILGVLEVQMSLESVQNELEKNEKQSIVASLILIVIVLAAAGLLIWHQVRKPIRILRDGTKAIALGDLDYSIRTKRKDEIGELANSFNIMVSELKKARDEITDWSMNLQERVDQKTEELKAIQSNLLHVEKMASLGKLSATVAHELNNPLGGILTYIKLTLKRLAEKEMTPELLEEIKSDLKIVADETVRCGNIVKNLLLFSKREIREYNKYDIRDIINQCLHLVRHHLDLNNIELVKNLPDKAVEAYCNHDQLQQALLALMMNAIEAMKPGDMLKVSLSESGNLILIDIEDTGSGIPEEFLPHIYEPFFTQKKEGKGVGLGLSVAFGIVESHKGKIEVRSKVDVGSIFTVKIPKNMEFNDKSE